MNKYLPLKGLVQFSFIYNDILGCRKPKALAGAPIEVYTVTCLVSTSVTSTFIEVFWTTILSGINFVFSLDEFEINLKVYLPKTGLSFSRKCKVQ